MRRRVRQWLVTDHTPCTGISLASLIITPLQLLSKNSLRGGEEASDQFRAATSLRFTDKHNTRWRRDMYRERRSGEGPWTDAKSTSAEGEMFNIPSNIFSSNFIIFFIYIFDSEEDQHPASLWVTHYLYKFIHTRGWVLGWHCSEHLRQHWEDVGALFDVQCIRMLCKQRISLQGQTEVGHRRQPIVTIGTKAGKWYDQCRNGNSGGSK